ncbi:putative N-acyl homoserine lactonase AttM [Acephala macrosclerotiorum]|nr:putative N-acyl homoserine lactonase AttM [Acephala macrosclerotiorum]
MPPSNFSVPASPSIVNIRIIDSTSSIRVPIEGMVSHTIKGHSWLQCPAYAFLIEHPSSGRKVLFDLGIRKDFHNLAPAITNWFTKSGTTCSVEKDIRTILEGGGVEGGGQLFAPGYPTNPESPVLDSDFADRELRELCFTDSGVKVGPFPSIDYFGDDSFYILDAPGHTVGHVNALARVTTNPDSFILMGADQLAEMRPSRHHPLSDAISPHPFHLGSAVRCPGALFKSILRDGKTTKPFYGVARPGMLFGDPDAAEETVDKVIEADGSGNTFVMIAHDCHLKDVVETFPKYANDFLKKGWIEKRRWVFLKDFKEAVDKRADEKL